MDWSVELAKREREREREVATAEGWLYPLALNHVDQEGRISADRLGWKTRAYGHDAPPVSRDPSRSWTYSRCGV
jgi:hypothetical protein